MLSPVVDSHSVCKASSYNKAEGIPSPKQKAPRFHEGLLGHLLRLLSGS